MCKIQNIKPLKVLTIGGQLPVILVLLSSVVTLKVKFKMTGINRLL